MACKEPCLKEKGTNKSSLKSHTLWVTLYLVFLSSSVTCSRNLTSWTSVINHRVRYGKYGGVLGDLKKGKGGIFETWGLWKIVCGLVFHSKIGNKLSTALFTLKASRQDALGLNLIDVLVYNSTYGVVFLSFLFKTHTHRQKSIKEKKQKMYVY